MLIEKEQEEWKSDRQEEILVKEAELWKRKQASGGWNEVRTSVQ